MNNNSITLDKFSVQILPGDNRNVLSLSVNEEGFFQLSHRLTDSLKGIPVAIFLLRTENIYY